VNERITLLALKASDSKTGWLDRQKFAELIVREYEDEIWNYVMVESAGSDDKFLIRGIVRSALHDAKQHFGVKQ